MVMGRIILLGAIPQPEFFAKFVGDIAREEGIQPVDASGNVVVQLRRDNTTGNDSYLACVEVENREGYVKAPFDCTDILSDEKFKAGDSIKVAPFGVKLLSKE